jgi:hypothetical protein
MAKSNKIKLPKGLPVGSAGSSQQLWSVGGASPNTGIQKTANFQSTQVPSFFYSPELTTESWVLPKSRQEILKWCRIFFNLEPLIQAGVKMHSQYPFSKFDIVTADPSVTEFYKEMAFNADFDLYNFLLSASLSYRKFGEAIPFGNMTSFKGADGKVYYKWSKFILLEPELVEIRQDVWGGETQFELIPTEEMKKSAEKILRGDDPNLEALKESIPPAILTALQQGKNIPLDPEHVSLIADITDPSATRGTPQIQCCFKTLIYQDWIRLAQTAQAQRYHFPVELWKIGRFDTNPPIIPTQAQLQQYQAMINQAIQQPPFSVVVPDIVNYEPIGVNNKLLPMAPEYEYIYDQIMMGMGLSKSLLEGDGPSFSSTKTMALHRLMMEYKAIRDRFENWIINHFFRPIAEKNNFYHEVNGRRKLILPEIAWYKSLDIDEEQAEKEMFLKLYDKGLISTRTFFSKFPTLNFETEQKHLEAEKGTVWDKQKGSRLPEEFTSMGEEEAGAGASLGNIPEPSEPLEPTEPTEPGEPMLEPGSEGLPAATPGVEPTQEIVTPTEITPPGGAI